MAATLEETSVTYEDLAAIELDFEEAELEITRTQTRLLTPLYTRRSATISQIPNFWPLVLEQAPPDIDQYIQPSDSALLLSSLLSLSVTSFEPEIDPRSIAIQWEFKPNEHFSDTLLEKKFWYRRDHNGFAGLVSEPIRVQWKSKEKDLTGGLLDLVCDAWEEEKKQGLTSTNGPSDGKGKGKARPSKSLTPAQKQLKKKISTTGMGGLSFFAWFGFIGQHVTAEESLAATKELKEKREKAKPGDDLKTEEADDKGEDEEDISHELEIFPDGEDLAIAISQDLWPGAIKYFTQAQEADAISDADFEDFDDDENMSDLNDAPEGSDTEADDDAPPAKKRKS